MAKKKPKANKALKYVSVISRNYGNALKGTKIYYESRKKPQKLRDDGAFQFGKNILEALRRKFSKNFKLILAEDTDSIKKIGKIYEVRISIKLLTKMQQQKIGQDRDIKNEIIQQVFSQKFPDHFSVSASAPYTSGTLAKVLSTGVSKKMSAQDKDALNKFLPEYLKVEAQSAVILKASTQVETLQELADDLIKEVKSMHPESWWQTYIQGKILLIQQGYIQSIEKMNIAIGKTKFPDFSMVTHDGYLDILEIKKPDTNILKFDEGRDNYYWDPEMARAISQLENYLNNISKHADAVRSYILDTYKIDLKIVRPRGIILAGDAGKFANTKQKDDFRLLSQGLKHITVLTYDELHIRLENYITVLNSFSAPKRKKKTAIKKLKKKKK